jgi:hypothetical protein
MRHHRVIWWRVRRRSSASTPPPAALNPRLMHISLTGFGLKGSRADMPCYDLIAEGYSG